MGLLPSVPSDIADAASARRQTVVRDAIRRALDTTRESFVPPEGVPHTRRAFELAYLHDHFADVDIESVAAWETDRVSIMRSHSESVTCDVRTDKHRNLCLRYVLTGTTEAHVRACVAEMDKLVTMAHGLLECED
jgi:hypothetical protein